MIQLDSRTTTTYTLSFSSRELEALSRELTWMYKQYLDGKRQMHQDIVVIEEILMQFNKMKRQEENES